MATAHTTSLWRRVYRVRMERGSPGATAASAAIGTGWIPPSLVIRKEYGLGGRGQCSMSATFMNLWESKTTLIKTLGDLVCSNERKFGLLKAFTHSAALLLTRYLLLPPVCK